jgi:hypothetical protein
MHPLVVFQRLIECVHPVRAVSNERPGTV